MGNVKNEILSAIYTFTFKRSILSFNDCNMWQHKKQFRFFPVDDFSRSKSFFSIANFRAYMVFDSWRFIDYSVKKKFQV